MIKQLQLLVILSSHLIPRVALLSPAGSNKGILVDWTLRLLLEGSRPHLPDLLGVEKTATIMRELPAEKFTSLSLILPEDCSHSDCQEARDNCTLSPADREVTRLVMRSTVERLWVVECSLFAQEDIPLRNGGLPGRRLAGSDRSRGESGEKETEQTRPGVAVRTPVVESYSNINTSQAGQAGQEVETETCNKLHMENITRFYQDCCLNNPARDARCALKTLLNSYEEQHRQVISTPVRPSNMTDPFATSEGEKAAEDISRLGKAFDLDAEPEVEKNRTGEDLGIQETVENISSWKSKYFTILGFFLVFLAIFLIVIVFLIYKIRQSKKENYIPPTSPGARLAVERRSREGYSSVMEEEQEEDRLPLTPATQQAQAFQY